MKRRDSLKGSLVWVLLVAELEFPEILVPRLPQISSNVNIKSTRKSNQLFCLCDLLLRALIYLHFVVLILICFWMIMPGVKYAINGCSSLRTTPRTEHWRKNIVAITTQDKVIDDNLKTQIKNWTLYTCRLFLLTWIFSIY